MFMPCLQILMLICEGLRLKDCFLSALQSKKIISKAKQIQQNRRLSNRQTQQKDARQNIINNRRGMQVIFNMHVYYSSFTLKLTL